MDAEALDEEIFWQAVISGHRKWAAEIEQHHNVRIEIVLSGYGHIFAHGKIFGEPTRVSAARAEIFACEKNVERLYYSVTLLQADPIRRGVRYHDSAELLGRPPRQAIVESGLQCIDVVLIGPCLRAAAMLAEDPRLYDAAKARALHAHELDAWTPHVSNLLAQADALRAAMAIEDALTSPSRVERTCVKWLPQGDGSLSSMLLKESFK
jgi:hypothetical protein